MIVHNYSKHLVEASIHLQDACIDEKNEEYIQDIVGERNKLLDRYQSIIQLQEHHEALQVSSPNDIVWHFLAFNRTVKRLCYDEKSMRVGKKKSGIIEVLLFNHNLSSQISIPDFRASQF